MNDRGDSVHVYLYQYSDTVHKEGRTKRQYNYSHIHLKPLQALNIYTAICSTISAHKSISAF